MKRPKCYLDRRQNCFHPELRNFCEKNTMICTKMKPIRGYFHEILRYYKVDIEWARKHPGFVSEDNFV